MGFLDFYFYADLACFVMLAFSLYFAFFSQIPAFDVRKIGDRKTFSLFFFDLGAAVKIGLIVMWYFLLQDVVVELSMDRCVLELFRKIGPLMWAACILKVVSVPAVLFHFSVRYIDKSFKSLPLTDYRVFAIFITVPLLIIESISDMAFIQGLKAYITSERESVFNLHAVSKVFSVSDMPFFWTFIYFISGWMMLIALYCVLRYSSEERYRISGTKLKYLKIISSALAVTYLISMLLSFNDELCPLFLELPNQHCLFCMLQCSFDLPILMCAGVFIFGWAVILPFIPHMADDGLRSLERRFDTIFIDKFQDIVKIIFVIALLQIIVVGGHIVLYILK